MTERAYARALHEELLRLRQDRPLFTRRHDPDVSALVERLEENARWLDEHGYDGRAHHEAAAEYRYIEGIVDAVLALVASRHEASGSTSPVLPLEVLCAAGSRLVREAANEAPPLPSAGVLN